MRDSTAPSTPYFSKADEKALLFYVDLPKVDQALRRLVIGAIAEIQVLRTERDNQCRALEQSMRLFAEAKEAADKLHAALVRLRDDS